jgi:predicted TIM-barrel fold metal-dependent hydrolase
MAIVAHVRDDPSYGRLGAETFLRIAASAPDVPIQVAHLWGGEGFSDAALSVFAEAASSGRLNMQNIYFDVADIAVGASEEHLQLMAARIRQIGTKRVLYGSDAALNGRLEPRDAWKTFLTNVPLSEAEFRTIASNIAPYLVE